MGRRLAGALFAGTLTGCSGLSMVVESVSDVSGARAPLVVVDDIPVPAVTLSPDAPPYISAGVTLAFAAGDSPAQEPPDAGAASSAQPPALAVRRTSPAAAAPASARASPALVASGSAPVPSGAVRPAGDAQVVSVRVARGASWWLYGRRYALSYGDLARLNGLSEASVRAGRGLRTGRTIEVVARTGVQRRGRLAWTDGRGGGDAWLVFPEGQRWRAPSEHRAAADGGLPAPALGDPAARWLRKPERRTFAAWALRSGMSLEALLAYNGVVPGSARGGEHPRGSFAIKR